MATAVILTVVGLIAVAATGRVSSGAPASVQKHHPKRHAAPERCLSARKAVPYYRQLTWAHQQAAYHELADFTPKAQGHSCPFARYAATEWQGRAQASRVMLYRWRETVGRTVDRLNRALSRSRMAGTGAILEQEGRRYGVSPYFMAAAAWTESSLGDAACDNYNAWGLGNCGSAWSVPSFSSWDEAISYYARYLSSHWPGHSSPWSFRGYAKCDSCWAEKTAEHMVALGAPSTRTTWP